MNKKLFTLMWFILSLVVFVWFWFAQDATIWDVSVNFCNWENDTKSLSMVLDSGKDWEICMEFSNFSENDVSIKYWFIDGAITADKYKSKACQNEWDKDLFWQYVRQEISEINIPSMQKVKQKAYVKFPAWLTGMMNGCLTYFVSNAKTTTSVDSAMFDVLVRKATFIDVLVGWELSRSLKLSNKNKSINTYYDSKKDVLVLEATFNNDGTINEWVIMNGTITNMFGYNVNFTGEVIKVLSDADQMLRIEVSDIPWYKWPFDVELNIISNPQFDFDPGSISDNMKESIYIDAKTNVFLMPWILIYIVWWFIVLITLIKALAKHLKFQ